MLGATLGARDYLERVCREIRRLDEAQVERVSDLIEDAYHAGRISDTLGTPDDGAFVRRMPSLIVRRSTPTAHSQFSQPMFSEYRVMR